MLFVAALIFFTSVILILLYVRIYFKLYLKVKHERKWSSVRYIYLSERELIKHRSSWDFCHALKSKDFIFYFYQVELQCRVCSISSSIVQWECFRYYKAVSVILVLLRQFIHSTFCIGNRICQIIVNEIDIALNLFFIRCCSFLCFLTSLICHMFLSAPDTRVLSAELFYNNSVNYVTSKRVLQYIS